MSKHTPGPWEVGSYREPYYDHELTYHVVSDGFIVARCGKGFETKENALLIAAAPELLEACELALENDDRAVKKVLRAAIAKARGKTG